ncbi:hypothetical protein [Solitalea canadensis]|uniref:Outer membrane lipoprotein-sorting protein n=1 Tax=Solitalea canadensis (strain ATCC 29591 / DSM 3403 / JCM 21819 / LMG 8368 / NBRC 15130 / NCIMB 12057 / USAM 9D) TaxID=929556 RepID=H8KL35_SOLCM|nr:hypothetical protein [Solitalea canadensis]AFD09118.1 hypothetical protein Solca_4128 [Solitalea canadensis DSM 3403]
MRNRIILTLTLIVSFCGFSLAAFAQASLDTTMSDFFQNSIAEKSTIYVGRFYKPYSKYKSKSNAFFGSEEWYESSLTYNENQYSVKLRYELVSDKVLTPGIDETNSIELTNEKVNSFKIDGHYFINLNENLPDYMNPGFYEVIYDGQYSFLSRRKKKVKEIIVDLELQYEFIETVEYFLGANNKFTKVSGLNKLLSQFPDKKGKIKKNLSDNDINFNRNREQALKAIGALINN